MLCDEAFWRVALRRQYKCPPAALQESGDSKNEMLCNEAPWQGDGPPAGSTSDGCCPSIRVTLRKMQCAEGPRQRSHKAPYATAGAKVTWQWKRRVSSPSAAAQRAHMHVKPLSSMSLARRSCTGFIWPRPSS